MLFMFLLANDPTPLTVSLEGYPPGREASNVFLYSAMVCVPVGCLLGCLGRNFFPRLLPSYPAAIGAGISLIGLVNLLFAGEYKRAIKALESHANCVGEQFLRSYGNDGLGQIRIVGETSSFAQVTSVSRFSPLTHYGLLESYIKNDDSVIFLSAGNDGEAMGPFLHLRNHGTNFLSTARMLAWVSRKFNIWGWGEESLRKNWHSIHCGVACRKGNTALLETYSNFPPDSNMRFLAVVLPEGCPLGTSMAAPIISGVFCRVWLLTNS